MTRAADCEWNTRYSEVAQARGQVDEQRPFRRLQHLCDLADLDHARNFAA